MREVGFAGIELDAWFGLVAPAGTPDAVIGKLNAAFVQAVRDPEIVKQVSDQGAEAVATTPAEFAAFIAAETERFGKIVKAVGARRVRGGREPRPVLACMRPHAVRRRSTFQSIHRSAIPARSASMTMWQPDPTFYPSPRMAMKAPAETVAYVAAFDPTRTVPDGIAVVDVDPGSATYSRILNTVAMPNAGDELHHFGWNACSSCLCPNAPHAHAERRYLVVPGLRSSRIHILDTKPDPRKPAIVKVVEPQEVAERAGYTRPHTVHCGPEGIYVAALGNREGKGPGGVFLMDPESFDVRGQWEMDRGPQHFAYDAWWHLGHDTMVTSEWGTPDTFENGLIPEVLLGAKYGRRLHFWDLHGRKHLQTIDFGDKYQLVFELRPAHDPTKAYGFVNCVLSLENLSSSIWTWYRDGGKWAVKKVIEIPAEPADPDGVAAGAQGVQGMSAAGDRHRSFDG